MQNIQINITERRAQVLGSPVLVCNNADNTVTFVFDDEWVADDAKTARFVYETDGQIVAHDVPFTGDTVGIPAVSNTRSLRVGVYANDIVTTTPAVIPCELSILCGSGEHVEPSEDVYNQIMALFNATVIEPSTIVDQTFNPESANPQSGVAVASVVDTLTTAIENNTIIDITEERTIRDLKNGVYRVSIENGAYLYLDDNYSYGCVNGIVVLDNNGTDYNWITVGLDVAWIPNIQIGNSIVDETGLLIANATRLTELLKTKDVLQVGDPTATYEPQQVYSANVINTQLAVPIMTDLTNLWQQKESVSNKVTYIDEDSTDTQYPTAKAVYDFGMNILAECQRMIDEALNK